MGRWTIVGLYAVYECLFDSIADCKIIDDFSSSDDCPLHLTFNLSYLPTMSQISRRVPCIKRNFDNELRRRDVYDRVDFRLRGLNLKLVRDCVSSRCQLNEHKTCTNEVYDQINEIIIDSCRTSFGYLRPAHQQMPGWNEYLKSHHAAYRECFLR